MRASTFFGIGAGLLSAVLPALGEHGHHARRHQDVARRAPGHVEVFKRASMHDNARYSFYATGLGACGKTNTDSDFIVAQNVAEFGSGYPGPNCFKMITISYGGKTTQAQITDACPGCPYGGLDMSPGLFEFFASKDVGIIYGKWWYSDDAPAAPTSTKAPPPPPTSTWKPEPEPTTSKWTPPPTPTSTWKPDPTTSSSVWVAPTTSSTPPPPPPEPSTSSAPKPEPSTSSVHSSSSSVAPSSSSSSEAAAFTPASTKTSSSAVASATNVLQNDSTGNALNALNQAILGLGGVAVAGAGAKA